MILRRRKGLPTAVEASEELLDAVLASAPAPHEDDEGERQMQALPAAMARLAEGQRRCLEAEQIVHRDALHTVLYDFVDSRRADPENLGACSLTEAPPLQPLPNLPSQVAAHQHHRSLMLGKPKFEKAILSSHDHSCSINP